MIWLEIVAPLVGVPVSAYLGRLAWTGHKHNRYQRTLKNIRRLEAELWPKPLPPSNFVQVLSSFPNPATHPRFMAASAYSTVPGSIWPVSHYRNVHHIQEAQMKAQADFVRQQTEQHGAAEN